MIRRDVCTCKVIPVLVLVLAAALLTAQDFVSDPSIDPVLVEESPPSSDARLEDSVDRGTLPVRVAGVRRVAAGPVAPGWTGLLYPGMEFRDLIALEAFLSRASVGGEFPAGVTWRVEPLGEENGYLLVDLVVESPPLRRPLDSIRSSIPRAVVKARPEGRWLSGIRYSTDLASLAFHPLEPDGGAKDYGFDAGLADGTLLIAPSWGWASAWSDHSGGPVGVLGFDATLTYLRDPSGEADRNVTLTANAGFSGTAPVPWTAIGTMLYDLDRSPYPSASFLAGFSLDVGIAGLPGTLGLYPAVEAMWDSAAESAALGVRLLALAADANWVGAFEEGWRSALLVYASTEPISGAWRVAVEGESRGALRFGKRFGISADLLARFSSTEYGDWAERLRGRSDAMRIVSGAAGLVARAEASVVFARGRLFNESALVLDAILVPFLDLAWVDRTGSLTAFDPENFLVTGGGELRFVLDTRRSDYVRVSAGFDLSDSLRAEWNGLGAEDLEFVAVFGLRFD